jgi:hypothetical protein
MGKASAHLMFTSSASSTASGAQDSKAEDCRSFDTSSESCNTQEQSLYYLAVVDDETGSALRPVTVEEAQRLASLLADTAGLTSQQCDISTTSKAVSGSCEGSAGGQMRSGGPCMHCHAAESPQWRRGPANKPTLCNACGTRYRRTSQLGPPMPMSCHRQAISRKRSVNDTLEAPAKLAKQTRRVAI